MAGLNALLYFCLIPVIRGCCTFGQKNKGQYLSAFVLFFLWKWIILILKRRDCIVETKKKMGWTAFGLIGSIFAPIGLLFVSLGAGLGLISNIRWRTPDEQMVFTALFCGIGGVFLVLGLIFLAIDLRRRYLLRRAYVSGNCVEAEILGVVEPRGENVFSGRTPVAQAEASRNEQIAFSRPRVLEAAWTDANGVVHIYRSRYLRTNVEKLLKSKTVPVYIDRYNENIGFVDVDAALPEIRVH